MTEQTHGQQARSRWWRRRRRLRELGFRVAPEARLPPLAALVLPPVALAAALLTIDPLDPERVLGAAVGAVTLGGVLTGLWQWRQGRRETSLERFFERLDHTTMRRLDASRARVDAGVCSAQEYAEELDAFYVFAELDTLDYTLRRFEQGTVSPRLAERAIALFQNRCSNRDGFASAAKGLVTRGAYDDEFRRIVRSLVDSAPAGEAVAESAAASLTP
jgi:hypothetical protein